MLLILLLSIFVHTTVQLGTPQNDTRKTFIYNKYSYDKLISLMVNSTTEQILDFTEEDDRLRGYPTRVHVSSNDTISADHPLFITAIQQKSVSSWELPLVVQTSSYVMQFQSMARTLCPHDAGLNTTYENRPTIQIATSNPSNTSVAIKLRRVQDFYIELGKELPIVASPSTPKYYYFSFNENPWNITSEDQAKRFLPRFNYTIPKSVILIIESDDDLCAIVSIQNNSCPVFDNEKDIHYQGYHLTMTTKGGITLTQSTFPVGFYVVFIVKDNDGECTGASETGDSVTSQDGVVIDQWEGGVRAADGRIKTFRLKVIATISYREFVVGALVMLALIIVIALFALVVYIPSCTQPEIEATSEESAVRPSTSADAVVVCENEPIINADGRDEEDSEPEVARSSPGHLTVARLSKSNPDMQSRRSNRYFWSALTVAVVYALPVVQLLSTYQYMVFQTGNQDLCYYNFLCAHPLGFLSDFNHVLSNAGYVLLGLVFFLQTRSRQHKFRNTRGKGIPQHWGLFYSMGLALVMEGLLSGCYHLCPNKMNFQFDSSFMYVIAVLCMVKLYQNRHPDVNASAHSTFMLIAFIMAIGLVGIMWPSVYFWVVFTIAHIAVCFILTLQIYYVGRLSMDRSIVVLALNGVRTHGRRAFVPSYWARAVLLTVGNLANWALAAFGLYEHNKDFARHLLAILMGNAIIYMVFYIVMKLVYRERILLHTWLYFLLANAAWFGALRLFLDSRTKWSETPANSRRHNAVCSALDFYDNHDMWHLASAAAMFLSFNMLLTIDDGLQDTPRHLIPVF